VDWLLQKHRDLIDAEFALNPDSGGVATDHGKPLTVEFEATESSMPIIRCSPPIPAGTAPCRSRTMRSITSRMPLAYWRNRPFPFELNA